MVLIYLAYYIYLAVFHNKSHEDSDMPPKNIYCVDKIH